MISTYLDSESSICVCACVWSADSAQAQSGTAKTILHAFISILCVWDPFHLQYLHVQLELVQFGSRSAVQFKNRQSKLFKVNRSYSVSCVDTSLQCSLHFNQKATKNQASVLVKTFHPEGEEPLFHHLFQSGLQSMSHKCTQLGPVNVLS